MRSVETLTQGATGYVDGEFFYRGRTAGAWIPDIVSRIVARFDPLKIVLFGSHARGDQGPDSDVDLMVVLEKVEDKREVAIEIRRALADIPVPIDLIPTDPAEIEIRGDLIGTILRPALREGRVLYDRAN